MKLIFSQNGSVIQTFDEVENLTDNSIESVKREFDSLEILKYSIIFNPGVMVSQSHDLDDILNEKFVNTLEVELR